jgi:exodeoxyribonuclease-3
VTLKLLSYNIKFGGGGREKHLAAVIGDSAPDIVILQEATDPRVVERLAKETGMDIWAAREGHSLAFMSRLPIARYEWYRPIGVRRPFLEVVVAETDLRVFGVHLSAIHSNWTERRRVVELQALLKLIEQHQHGFHVLVGDFNTLAPGDLLEIWRLPFRLWPFIWLSGGKIKWKTIQIMLDAGYVDGHRMLYPEDKGFTFPTWDPHVRLDYLFLPTAFAERLIECKVMKGNSSAASASDHFPLRAQIEVDQPKP